MDRWKTRTQWASWVVCAEPHLQEAGAGPGRPAGQADKRPGFGNPKILSNLELA